MSNRQKTVVEGAPLSDNVQHLPRIVINTDQYIPVSKTKSHRSRPMIVEHPVPQSPDTPNSVTTPTTPPTSAGSVKLRKKHSKRRNTAGEVTSQDTTRVANVSILPPLPIGEDVPRTRAKGDEQFYEKRCDRDKNEHSEQNPAHHRRKKEVRKQKITPADSMQSRRPVADMAKLDLTSPRRRTVSNSDNTEGVTRHASKPVNVAPSKFTVSKTKALEVDCNNMNISPVGQGLTAPFDNKSGASGRVVVLKAAVSGASENKSDGLIVDTGSEAANREWQLSQRKTSQSRLPHGSAYWTVTAAQGVQSGILDRSSVCGTSLDGTLTISPMSSFPTAEAAGSRGSSSSTTPGSGSRRTSISVHSRFKQFLVESFGGPRSRTRSEQYPQTLLPPYAEAPTFVATPAYGTLPPHAHTVSAGTGRLLAAAVPGLTRATQDDNVVQTRDTLAPPSAGFKDSKYPTISIVSFEPNDSTEISRESDRAVSSFVTKQYGKSPRRVIGRLLHRSSSPSITKHGKHSHKYKEGSLPDPSKLPLEEPQSSLEFTQSRLKNLPRKGPYTPNDRRPIKGGSEEAANQRGNYLLSQTSAKSDELLIESFSRQPTQSPHHHHRHHHHHHHHHHSHTHRNQHSSPRHRPTLTRVTESRRYLTFTKALPFNSPNEYLLTRGKGLGDSEPYSVLFKHTTCYELMPDSAKLVTLDSNLTINKAFRALCFNGIRAAPVWNSKSQSFIGMLTITDFLHMLNVCWRPSNLPGSQPLLKLESLESITIGKWKELCYLAGSDKQCDKETTINIGGSSPASSTVASGGRSRVRQSSGASDSTTSSSGYGGAGGGLQILPTAGADDESVTSSSLSLRQGGLFGQLITIHPEESLFRALSLLSSLNIHRLPVLDDPINGTGNTLYVLTHRCLLAYIYTKQIDLPRPNFLIASLQQTKVGTYESLAMVTSSTKLADALLYFEGERISALPVVDSLSSRRLVDIFAKFDVITLILAGSYKDPDLTVKEVLDICKNIHRGFIPVLATVPEGPNRFAVETCLVTDTLQHVMDRMMRTGYHRLIIVDNHYDCRVEGMVSISDLLHFMVLQQSQPGRRSGAGTSAEESEDIDVGDSDIPEWCFTSPPNAASIAEVMARAHPSASHRADKDDSDHGESRHHGEASIPEVKTLTQLDGKATDKLKHVSRPSASLASGSTTDSDASSCSSSRSSSSSSDISNSSTCSGSSSVSANSLRSPTRTRERRRPLTHASTLNP